MSRKSSYAIVILAVFSGFSNAQSRIIEVVSATYGANCGARGGNATRDFMRQCNGRSRCEYVPSTKRISVPARFCRKDLRADWRCTDTEWHFARLSPEAGAGSTLVLSVQDAGGDSALMDRRFAIVDRKRVHSAFCGRINARAAPAKPARMMTVAPRAF
jgi:hypothetical protein